MKYRIVEYPSLEGGSRYRIQRHLLLGIWSTIHHKRRGGTLSFEFSGLEKARKQAQIFQVPVVLTGR